MNLNLRKSSKHRILRIAGWSWQSGLHRAVLREGLGELRKEPSRGVVTGAALASPRLSPGSVLASSLQPQRRRCFPKVLEVPLPPIEPGFPFLDSLV